MDAVKDGIGLFAGRHLPRQRLGQEIRSLQVDAQQLFEALLGGFEDVGAYAWRAAGVVDERIDGAVALGDLIGQARAIGGAAHVGLEVIAHRPENVSSSGATASAPRTPHNARRQPSAASARAMPRPMPRVPPVTSAVRGAGLRRHDAGPKNVRYGCWSAKRRMSSAASRR